jgi:hypothetical protein
MFSLVRRSDPRIKRSGQAHAERGVVLGQRFEIAPLDGRGRRGAPCPEVLGVGQEVPEHLSHEFGKTAPSQTIVERLVSGLRPILVVELPQQIRERFDLRRSLCPLSTPSALTSAIEIVDLSAPSISVSSCLGNRHLAVGWSRNPSIEEAVAHIYFLAECADPLHRREASLKILPMRAG